MISKEALKKLADLARLRIDDADIETYLQGVGNLLALVDQIQSVPVPVLDSQTKNPEKPAVIREDTITEHDQRDTILALAPSTQAQLFLVPQVIE